MESRSLARQYIARARDVPVDVFRGGDARASATEETGHACRPANSLDELAPLIRYPNRNPSFQQSLVNAEACGHMARTGAARAATLLSRASGVNPEALVHDE